MRTACVLPSGGLLGPRGLNQLSPFPRQRVLLKMWLFVLTGVLGEIWPFASSPCSVLSRFSLLGVWNWFGGWICTVCVKPLVISFPPLSNLYSAHMCWEPVLCQSLLLLLTQVTALEPLPQFPLHLLKEVDMLFKKCECFHSCPDFVLISQVWTLVPFFRKQSRILSFLRLTHPS